MKGKIVAVITAILLLAGGALYAASEVFGIDLSSYLVGWWTLFLIIPGLVGLIFNKYARLPSFGLLLLGIALLAKEQLWLPQLADVSFGQILFPIMLVVAALGVLRGVFGKKHRVHITYDSENKNGEQSDGINIDLSNIRRSDANSVSFSSRREDYSGKVFSGADISCAFGLYELDLRNAIIESDCSIKADAAFGRLVIYRSPNANFVCTGDQVFGAVSAKTSAVNSELPTVTVHADAAFGSIEIK